MGIRRLLLFVGLMCVVLPGCQPAGSSGPAERAPRPISVIALKELEPRRVDRVAASVRSWKTEQIGFEVSGRVRYVIEPDSAVEGQVHDAEGKLLSDGTELARLDDTRYQIQVKSAQAQINTSEEKRKAALTGVESVIPAQQRAADAEMRVARAEFQRQAELFQRSSTSQANYDRARGDWERAQARVTQLAAQREAKRAEVASLEAEIQQLQESLAAAERDVEDCRLVAPYRGQVAEVHVIPGAFVERGQPVLTLQMMDPIAIEFEVSAGTARRMNYRDMIPTRVPQPDRDARPMLASVYIIDPVADPQTRTFTVTLLARNEKVRTPVPEDMKGQPVVRTANLWTLITRPVDGAEKRFVEEKAVQQDGQGPFLWKVTNRQVGTLAGEATSKLAVTKVRVTPGDRRISFLGIWVFREVTMNEGQPFNPSTDIVAGEVVYPPEVDAGSWDGGVMLFDRGRWLLRPGDLVEVDLAGRATRPGFYVPASSILEKTGRTYVFAVESSEGGDRARQIEVGAFDSVGTLRRIEAGGSEPLRAGMQIAAGGALFLTDGEKVNVVEEVEVER